MNYDAAGNVISDPSTGTTHTYQWDAEGRLASVDNGSRYSLVYNALGNRAAYVYPSATYEDLYDLAGNSIGFPGSWSTVFLGSRHLVTYYGGGSGNSVTEFAHLNALASTTMQTNYSGGVMGDLSFYPWGKMFTEPQAGYGFDFAGMTDVDTGIGLRFTPNRIYSLNLNRWLSPDPGGAHEDDPQTWNAYAYVGNNPTSRTDPGGDDFYLVGGNACGDAVKCDKQGYVTDGGSRVVISDQDFLNGTNGVRGNVDDKGNVSITTAQGTFQGEFTGSSVSANITVGVGHDEAVGMMLQSAGGMAENGVAVTSFVTSPAYLVAGVTFASGIASGSGLTTLSGDLGVDLMGNQAVNQAMGVAQRELLKQLFRTGELPPGVTVRTLQLYREIALRAIQAGQDRLGVQAVRLALIDKMIQRLTGR